jgi:nicotinic acid mononucleotide adenylyltransferase
MGPAVGTSSLLNPGSATTADIAAAAATGVASPTLGASGVNAASGTVVKSPVVISVEDAEAMRCCLAGGGDGHNAASSDVAAGGDVANGAAGAPGAVPAARGHQRISSGRLRPATLRELVTADLTQRLGKSVHPCIANPLQILLERKDVLTRLVVNRNGDVHFDGVRAAHDPTQPEPHSDEPCCPAQAHYLLYPGSFAPLHYGHMELARVASFVVRRRASGYNSLTGGTAVPPKPVFLTFEISSSRVNKRELNERDLRSYIDQFTRNGMRVGVSNAMLFIDKARAFPNHAFIVGADTAERVINPTYYAGSYEKMLEALREIEALGCYFVVGGRKIEQTGEWVAPKDIRYPPEMEHLFVPISANDFRVDVSSTEIRARRGSREGLDLME